MNTFPPCTVRPRWVISVGLATYREVVLAIDRVVSRERRKTHVGLSSVLDVSIITVIHEIIIMGCPRKCGSNQGCCNSTAELPARQYLILPR